MRGIHESIDELFCLRAAAAVALKAWAAVVVSADATGASLSAAGADASSHKVVAASIDAVL
jgi:hypothetical protein